MAYDGHVKIGTILDKKGLEGGLKSLSSLAVKAVAGVSASLGAAAAAAIKVGSSFEAEMSKVAAISGATGEDLESLKEKAKEMGAQTKFSASESAQAMEYMAMAGWKATDMLNGIEGIMNLAAASGEDLASTSDIVTDALTAFNMTVEESTHFADILAKASSNANTNVGMMGETFKYVAPVAGALGYSAEDAAIAIGLMANRGIKAGQAGTALRSILTRLVKPVGEAKDAVEDLGLSLTNADGSMKPFSETIAELREKFSGLTESEKAQYAAMLAGQEGMSGLLAITEASEEEISKLTESIYNCDGAAAQMAATTQDNLQGQLTAMKSAAETLGIEIYESMQESLKGLATAGAEAIRGLTEAFKTDGVSGLLESGAALVADIAIGMAKATPGIVGAATTIISEVANSLTGNIPELISAGGALVQSLIEGALEMGEALWAFGSELLSILYENLMENIPTIMEAGTQIIANLISGISEALPTLIESGLALVLELLLGIVTNLPVLVDAGIQMLLSLAQGLINSLPLLIEKVPQIINTFAEAVYAAIPQLIIAGFELIGNLCQGIINAIPTVIANARQIVTAILNTITLLNLFSAGKNIIKGLVDGIKGMFGNVTTAAKKLIELIKNPFKFDWASIGRNIIDGITAGIKAAAHKLAEAAKNAVSAAIKAAKDFLGIHSPSRLARDVIGKNLIAGVGVGVEQETPELEKISQNSMAEVVSGMKGKAYSIYPEYRTIEFADRTSEEKKEKELIDYEKMASVLKTALEGMGITFNDREFARLVWEAT